MQVGWDAMGRALIALAALLVIAPAAFAQTAPTEPGIYNPTTISTESKMYFHINGFQDFPINTQKPDDRYADRVEVGAATHSGCIADPAGAQHFTDRSYHTWYGYSSPSYVQYDVDENGEPRIHQERGLSYDIKFDSGTQPTFSWFLEGKAPGNVEGTDASHPPIPNVIVRATIRQGDDISVGNAKFNDGAVVAIGQTEPVTLSGAMTQGNDNVIAHQVGNTWIYEFTFPLSLEKQQIDKKESYNVRVDAFMDNPYCADPSAPKGGDYMFLNFALVHTSSDFRPMVKWNIMNPIMIEALHPQFVGDDLVVHTASNSPYGSYDVLGDLKSEQAMVLEIVGPSPAMTLDQVALVDHSLGHGPEEHFKAVAATWLWDYQADQAKDGKYTVTLRVQNDQQTAEAIAVATFEIGNGKAKVCGRNLGETEDTCIEPENANKAGQDSPGIGVTAIAGLLGAAAVLARRRF